MPVTEEKSRFFQRFLPFGREKPLDRTAKGFSFAYSSFKVITMSLFSMAVATSASLLSKPHFHHIVQIPANAVFGDAQLIGNFLIGKALYIKA